MPKKVNRGPYEREIKELLGLPAECHILKIRTYTKEYDSVRHGKRTYYYYAVNYYLPAEGKIYRKHIREKDRERKAKVLALWRLELKYRAGEKEGAGDRHIKKLFSINGE